MKLKNILNEQVISTSLKGTTKEEIIKELLEILAKTGQVSDTNSAFEDLMEREQKMSTGIQHGVLFLTQKQRV